MRLQFEVSEEQNKKIETLVKEVSLRTKKDLFNNAITLLNWAVKQYKAGRIIVSIDKQMESYRELAMPILDNVAEGNDIQPSQQGNIPIAKES